MTKVAVGCDPNAADMKQVVIAKLKALGYEVSDFESDDPIYANVAIAVAERVAAGEYDRGILLCGTGIGVSIAANKVNGAYAAVCSDAYSAERAKASNNANIMCLGAQVMGPKLAEVLVERWMAASFDPESRSGPKVRRICEYEERRV